MAYSRTFVVNGITTSVSNLRAEVRDDAGFVLDSGLTGFIDLGNGSVSWTYATFADNSAGSIRFYDLTAGTLVSIAYNATYVVAPSVTATVESVVIPPPGAPGFVTGYLHTRDALGVLVGGKTCYWRMVTAPVGYGTAWSNDVQTVTSDVNGLVTISMIENARYEVWSDVAFRRSIVADPLVNPVTLPSLIY